MKPTNGAVVHGERPPRKPVRRRGLSHPRSPPACQWPLGSLLLPAGVHRAGGPPGQCDAEIGPDRVGHGRREPRWFFTASASALVTELLPSTLAQTTEGFVDGAPTRLRTDCQSEFVDRPVAVEVAGEDGEGDRGLFRDRDGRVRPRPKPASSASIRRSTPTQRGASRSRPAWRRCRRTRRTRNASPRRCFSG